MYFVMILKIKLTELSVKYGRSVFTVQYIFMYSLYEIQASTVQLYVFPEISSCLLSIDLTCSEHDLSEN